MENSYDYYEIFNNSYFKEHLRTNAKVVAHIIWLLNIPLKSALAIRQTLSD